MQEGPFYHLWYTAYGSDNKIRIAYAYSYDRVTFTKWTYVIEPSGGDDGIVSLPSVVHVGGLYYMWYCFGLGNNRKIGEAYSSIPEGQAGVGFIRSAHNPVLVPSELWESKGVLQPTVLWDPEERIFRMWYVGQGSDNYYRIGYAVSVNGYTWSKRADPVLSAGLNEGFDVWMPSVVKLGALFWMWYSASGGIRSAYSLDGITWTRWYENPVMSTSSLPNAIAPCVFLFQDSSWEGKNGLLLLGMYYGEDRIDFALADFGLGIAPVFMNPPAGFGETYFINPDPSRTQYTPYDSLSAGILYGLESPSVNHYMGFDTNADWVSQGTPPTYLFKGKLKLSGQWVVTFGGRMPNTVVACYEVGLTTKWTPIYCAFESGQNQFISRSTNAVVAALSPSLTEHEDYVVIERVWEYDNKDNILMIFGFTWKGTWAGGIYFKDYFWTHSHEFVGYEYVILHWVDNNMDGTPQANEISAVAAG